MDVIGQVADELFNEAVMHDVPLGGHELAFCLPLVVQHMVAPDAQLKRFLRQPEEREHDVLLVLIARREHQHQRGQVGRAGQVQPAVALASLQFVRVNVATVHVPLVHGHPQHGGRDPLVQAELAEHGLVRGRFQRLVVGVPHLLDVDGVAQRRVRLVPVLLLVPVLVVLQPVDDRIKARVGFPPLDEVKGFLVNLPADGVSIRPGSGQEKPQRLLSGVAGALRHDVVQCAGGLRVQLVEDARADVQTVLGGDVAGQHLIDAAGGQIHHALCGRHDFDALHERGRLPHHIGGHVKHNAGLLAVGRAGIDLRLPLVVVDQHVQRQRRAQLGFTLFLGDFDVCRRVLPHVRAVVPHRAEHIADDFLLPRQQGEVLPVELALRVLQILHELNHALRSPRIEHLTSLPPAGAP